jgi:hypothetical protein
LKEAIKDDQLEIGDIISDFRASSYGPDSVITSEFSIGFYAAARMRKKISHR